MCKKAQNNYQKYFLSNNWACNKKVILNNECICIWFLSIRSVMALIGDITSSPMDKNHIQIYPWYSFYIYILVDNLTNAGLMLLKDFYFLDENIFLTQIYCWNFCFLMSKISYRENSFAKTAKAVVFVSFAHKI